MTNDAFHISASSTKKGEALIRINGDISGWENSAKTFQQQVDTITGQGTQNARIKINSGGGDVFQANEICNIIDQFTGEVVAEIGAICASAATMIALSADRIEMAKNGKMMIHRPSGRSQGTEDKIAADLKVLRSLQADYLARYAAKTGMSESEISSLWQTDYWMDATEAKAKGFIDVILDREAPKVSASISETTKSNQMNNDQIDVHARVASRVTSILDLSASASADDVSRAINDLKERAEQAAYYKAKFEDLHKEVQEVQISMLVETAIKSGKITANQKDQYTALAKADYDTTASLIDSLQGRKSLSDQIKDTNFQASNQTERGNWTWADWAQKDNDGLQVMMKEDEPTFVKLYEEEYGIKPIIE